MLLQITRMKKVYLFALIALLLNAVSCTSETKVVENNLNGEVKTIDSVHADSAIQNDLDSQNFIQVDMSSAIDKDGYVDEEKERLQAIVKKSPQLDFCTCIVRIDSMEKALNEIDGPEWDKLWSDYEIFTEKCKVVLAVDDTPEGRKNHKRKVDKCLKNAK